MIVTILPKSATFHAIAYNEKKVSEGRAQLLEMKGISGVASFPGYTPEEMTQFFMDYSARNDRIKYPQFHIAVSCKGTECTYEELLEFGRKYLQEMGYNRDGQPMLAYAHTDTDNRHVHFITSRVAPDGHKIEHSHERRRSQQVIAKLSGKEIKEKVDGDIDKAWNYTIKSIDEFRLVMQSLGYECYAKENSRKVFIKHGGSIQHSLSFDEVDAHLWKNSHSIADDERAAALRKRGKELYAMFNKYRHGCGSLDDFADRVHRICGVSMVFLGSKDNPSGYRVVDHVQKAVFYAPIELSKLQFLSYEDRHRASLDMISRLLAENPQATSKEIGRSLYRQYGTRIKDHALVIDHKKEPLDTGTAETLRKNNIEAFKAANPRTATTAPATKETPRKPGGVAPQNRTIAQGHSVNRDWEINSDSPPDDLDEQMRRQMKL